MGAEWARLLAEHWPVLSLAALLLFGVYMCVRFVALAFRDSLGPIGEYFRTRRAITAADRDDMIARIKYMDEQVRALRYRDECYFAYMLVDQEWHRKHELMAAQFGWAFDPHITFLEFRDAWMKARGLTNEDIKIWT